MYFILCDDTENYRMKIQIYKLLNDNFERNISEKTGLFKYCDS